MNKRTKALSIILIINILISIILNLFTYKSFAAAIVNQTTIQNGILRYYIQV